MNLLECLQFFYKDFENIKIVLPNEFLVYDGKIDNLLLEKVLFFLDHTVYWHKLELENNCIIVRIR